MRKVIAIILMFIGIGLIFVGIKIFVNDELTVFEEDEEEVNDIIKTKKNVLDYNYINSKLVEKSYGSYNTTRDYGAKKAMAWKSPKKSVSGQEVEGDIEVYLLEFKDAREAGDFFTEFQKEFNQVEKKYDTYKTAAYKFGGAIDRYCYKVVYDKYVLYLLGYDKNEYESIINYLAFDK